MLDYLDEIRSSSFLPKKEARKIFLNHRPAALYNNQEVLYAIREEIAFKQGVPLSCIYVCGSAQVGYSPFKKKYFNATTSDLDVAIISSSLYAKYLKISLDNSRSLTDIGAFPVKEKEDKDGNKYEINVYDEFCMSLARGMFRPDLMPHCKERSTWFGDFATLSRNYKAYFKSINAGIYLSEDIFLDKQSKVITAIKSGGV